MVRGIAVLALALGACMAPHSEDCGDGRLCPAGTVCAAGVPGCYAPAQQPPCRDLDEGAACAYGDPPEPGVCTSGICIIPRCGNGVIDDDDEACDCGSPDHAAAPAPGCDRFNADDGGLCDLSCRLHCDDGRVQDPEQCEPSSPLTSACADVGFDFGTLGCTGYCGFLTTDCGEIGLRPEPLGDIAGLDAAWALGDRVVAISGKGQVFWHDAAGWSAPYLLSTDGLGDVHGVDEQHLFIVGAAGLIVRWNGTGWTAMPSPTAANLDALWMVAPDDGWAAGDAGTLLHWDGVSWQLASLPGATGTLRSVYATADRVFVVEDSGRIWQGTPGDWQFTDIIGPALDEIAGRADDDVYVVGEAGTVLHWNGVDWLGTPLLTTGAVHDLWLDADEAFFVGDAGVVLHESAGSWTQLERVTTNELRAVAGTSAASLLIAGRGGVTYHYPGLSWLVSATPTTASLRDLWYTPGVGIVASGDDGITVREIRGSLEMMTVVTTMGPLVLAVPLRTVYAPGPDDIYVASDDQTRSIRRWDGASWTWIDGDGRWADLWGPGDDHVFAVGENDSEVRVQGYDGVSWAAEPVAPNITPTGISGTAPRRVVVVNSSEAWWLDGTTWTFDGSGKSPGFHSVWLAPDDTAIAVGPNGNLWRHDDAWAQVLPPLTLFDLLAVHGTATDDIFAVGRAGTMLWYDGAAWSRVRTGTLADLTGVWVTPMIVYATGTEGTLLRLLRSTF